MCCGSESLTTSSGSPASAEVIYIQSSISLQINELDHGGEMAKSKSIALSTYFKSRRLIIDEILQLVHSIFKPVVTKSWEIAGQPNEDSVQPLKFLFKNRCKRPLVLDPFCCSETIKVNF
jgi:hypothetical protein